MLKLRPYVFSKKKNRTTLVKRTDATAGSPTHTHIYTRARIYIYIYIHTHKRVHTYHRRLLMVSDRKINTQRDGRFGQRNSVAFFSACSTDGIFAYPNVFRRIVVGPGKPDAATLRRLLTYYINIRPSTLLSVVSSVVL